MKTIYIAIDKGDWTNIVVGYTEKEIVEKIMEKDVYFATEQDCYDYYEDSYMIERWEIKEDK